MKKLGILLSFVLFTCSSALAQFEGKIEAKMTVVKVPDEMKGHEAMFNQSSVTYIKGKKSRIEQTTMMSKTVILGDEEKKESIILLDLFGQKSAFKTTYENDAESTLKEFEKEGGKVTVTNETKVIIGYTCKKYLVVFPDQKDMVMEVWVTDEIGNYSNQYDMIAGMPLEFNIEMEGIVMKYTVTAISKESVSDSLFLVPDGYTFKSEEEMKKFLPMIGE